MAIYLQRELYWMKNIIKMKKRNKTEDKKNKVQEKNLKSTKKKNINIENQNKVIEEKQNKIDELTENIKEEKDKYVRLYAELENFRKRTAKEKLELLDTASENLMKNLLPILDDFERALVELKKNKEDELVKGVELIYEKFKKTLEKEGLKHIQVNKGDDFDPNIHEAVAQVSVEDKKMKNKIIDVVEQGYQLGQKNIRYPKVVTGK